MPQAEQSSTRMRRCLGFAEPDGGWLGGVVGDQPGTRETRRWLIQHA
jgi:hypothetical protein